MLLNNNNSVTKMFQDGYLVKYESQISQILVK